MKISQKLVSLRCRVLVKNKRLVVFWLLIKMHVLTAGWKQKNALISSACPCLQTLNHMHPFLPCRRGRAAPPSSSGSGSDVGDQHLPSPMAYGTHVLHESGCSPNKTHSNTAGKWHWHKRRGQIFHRSARPDTHHTSGRPAHTALPPPRQRETGVSGQQRLKALTVPPGEGPAPHAEHAASLPGRRRYHPRGRRLKQWRRFVLTRVTLSCFTFITDYVIKRALSLVILLCFRYCNLQGAINWMVFTIFSKDRTYF